MRSPMFWSAQLHNSSIVRWFIGDTQQLTPLTKCVVVWCCGCCFEYPQGTTTHFNKMCCCMVLWVLFRVPTTTHFAVRFSGVRSWIFKGSDLRSYREMILNVCAGMCTVRDGCLGVDSNQRPFRHWSDRYRGGSRVVGEGSSNSGRVRILKPI